MKRYVLLLVLCTIGGATMILVQKMHVLANEVSNGYSGAEVDSVMFAGVQSEPMVFSVCADKQVQFSMGNLQYTQSTDIWSFATEQYAFIGEANVLSNGVLADTIDLFGWSGSTALAKWGISTSLWDDDFSGNFVDWGQNIGDGMTWRTLTKDEWDYVLNIRTNASSHKGVARIKLNDGGTKYANGLILLPDNWQAPDGVIFKSGFANGWSIQEYANYQTFTHDEWRTLENAGAIFLPASGGCFGSNASGWQNLGYYWSATLYGVHDSYCLGFGSGGTDISNIRRHDRESVRLVKDVID